MLVLLVVLLLRLSNGAQEGGRTRPQLDRERRQGQPPKHLRACGGPWQGSGKPTLEHYYEYSYVHIIRPTANSTSVLVQTAVAPDF